MKDSFQIYLHVPAKRNKFKSWSLKQNNDICLLNMSMDVIKLTMSVIPLYDLTSSTPNIRTSKISQYGMDL